MAGGLAGVAARVRDRRFDPTITCTVAAPAAGVLTILATYGGSLNPTTLVNISDQDPLAGLARGSDPHFHLVTAVQHYDGAYYYAIARDPILQGRAHTLIDEPAYRYGHPLHGWLAGLLSLGQPRLVPYALLLLSLAGLAVTAWAVSRLAVQFGRTPWAGLVVAISPGLLYATTVSTTETVGAALIALTLLAWERDQLRLAVALIVAVCFDKETYLVVPLGLGLWELVRAWRVRELPDRVGSRVLALGTGPVLVLVWWCYVRSQLHVWPWQDQHGNLGAPVEAWRQTLAAAHGLANSGAFEASEIGTTAPTVLIIMAILLVAAAIKALPLRTVLDGPMLGFVVVASMQESETLLYPHELLRTLSVILLLAIGVLFARLPVHGASAAPPRRDTFP